MSCRAACRRTGFKWSGAFRAFQEQIGSIGRVPVLSVGEMSEAAFARWYRAHRPDVVIGHFDECLAWLRKLRRRVLPAVPRTWHVPGLFVDGPTVCAAEDVLPEKLSLA